MSSDPQIPVKPKQPFAKYAARASWVVPICVLWLDHMFYYSVNDPYFNSLMGGLECLLFLGVYGLEPLLILLGTAMGIIALAGGLRHGRKGILAQAIVGLCLNAAVVMFLAHGWWLG